MLPRPPTGPREQAEGPLRGTQRRRGSGSPRGGRGPKPAARAAVAMAAQNGRALIRPRATSWMALTPPGSGSRPGGRGPSPAALGKWRVGLRVLRPPPRRLSLLRINLRVHQQQRGQGQSSSRRARSCRPRARWRRGAWRGPRLWRVSSPPLWWLGPSSPSLPRAVGCPRARPGCSAPPRASATSPWAASLPGPLRPRRRPARACRQALGGCWGPRRASPTLWPFRASASFPISSWRGATSPGPSPMRPALARGAGATWTRWMRTRFASPWSPSLGRRWSRRAGRRRRWQILPSSSTAAGSSHCRPRKASKEPSVPRRRAPG
mmetsp:Transcript_29669/g.70705  ORF Transcript_29669/g.70705 Transcript_29669/m.70705 type:complete len:322 (-) Transcript_29669:205-1170(-)